jgi:hypothetical protein
MVFIVGFPDTQAGFDSIWVIVDHFMKVTHFIPIKMTYSGANIYKSRIVFLHVLPKNIVSDRGT